MATILNRGVGRRAIQFENLDGERKMLGLGKCPAKVADAIKVKLESLIACRLAQESLDSETGPGGLPPSPTHSANGCQSSG